MSNALGPKKNYSQDSSSGNTFFSAKNRSESFFNDVKTNGQPNNIIQKKNNGISNNQPVQFFWGDAYKVLKSGVGGVNVLNILSGGSRVANALGPVGRAIPYFGLGTGIADMITGDNIFDQAAGAARAIGGGAGIAGSFGAIPTVASLANAPVIGAGALSAGGALGSAGAAATTVGGVLMAGAAGYGVGRGLDWGADKIGDLITGNEAEDHSISGLMAGAMHRGDRLFTSTMRGLGVYDENAPEYTQTIGWQLADMVDGISNGASDVWDSVSGGASDAWDSVSGGASDVWDSVSGGASDAWDSVSGGASDAWDSVSGGASDAWDSVSGGASDAWDSVSGGASDAWDSVSGGASDAWDSVSGGASDAWDSVSGGASDAWDSVSGGASDAWNSVSGGASDAWDSLMDLF